MIGRDREIERGRIQRDESGDEREGGGGAIETEW